MRVDSPATGVKDGVYLSVSVSGGADHAEGDRTIATVIPD